MLEEELIPDHVGLLRFQRLQNSRTKTPTTAATPREVVVGQQFIDATQRKRTKRAW